jgi:four helix bundle protein
MTSKSYRDLLVWQKAMDLVEETYRLTGGFPKQEEFGLKAQMRRAAVSIPSNIAEGQGRHQHKVFRQFLTVAMGSLSELETQLELSVRLRFLTEGGRERASCLCKEIGKMLYGLARSLPLASH